MGISTHNGTLTISTKYESGNGYDMGENHTYRYVKTSGLGIAPRKWCGDAFNAKTTLNGTTNTYTYGIFYIHNNIYYALCYSNVGNNNFNAARSNIWTISIDAGVLTTNQTIANGHVPTLREATYGPIYGISAAEVVSSNVGYTPTLFLNFDYWTSTYYSSTSNTEAWFIYSHGTARNDGYKNSNKAQVPFVTIPLS